MGIWYVTNQKLNKQLKALKIIKSSVLFPALILYFNKGINDSRKLKWFCYLPLLLNRIFTTKSCKTRMLDLFTYRRKKKKMYGNISNL